MEQLAALVALTLAAGTPLVFAALGELVTERNPGCLTSASRG